MKRVSRYILLCAFLISFALPGWGATYPVTKSGNGADEAISSITVNNQACTTLSAVVTNAQEGDTIEVGAGTYILSAELNPTKKNITLKTTAGAILSGNSTRRVIYLTNGSEGFTLDGFTIKDGNAGTNYAGGVMVYNTTATLKNCTITNNKAVYGAGVAAYFSGSAEGKLTIDNCKFTKNVAGNGTTSGYGGGMIGWIYNTAKLELVITNSTFSDENKAGGPGGAININAGTNCQSGATLKTTIENCIFDGNVAGTGGALEYEVYGTTTFGLKIANCLFNKNITHDAYYDGGGAFIRILDQYNSSNQLVSTTTATVDTEIGYSIENCTFTDNQARRGAGLRFMSKVKSQPFQIKNCTFSGNKTTDNTFTGALYNIGYTTVTNCTFMNNEATGTNKWGADVFNTYSSKGEETKLELINSIFGSGAKSLCNDTEENANPGEFNLTNCAYVDGALVSTKGDKKGITTTNCFTTEATDASKKWAVSDLTENKDVEINGVKHTVYKITNASSNLTDGGKTGNTVPEKDILGFKRDAENPSIGAVEYVDGISITTSSLPAGTYNTAYSAALAAEFNPAQENVTYIWEISSGDLPDGLALVDDKITGTPSKTGTFKFTLKVMDDTNPIYATYQPEKEFSITINPPTIKITPATAELKGGTVNEEYYDVLTNYFSVSPNLMTGHEYTWKVAADALPPELKFDDSTKAITGSTVTAGTISFDVTVTAPAAAGSVKATARATIVISVPQTLDLSGKTAEEIKDSINSMTTEEKESISTLNLSEAADMTTLDSIQECVNLKTLDITNCGALETADLSKMTQLTTVSADGCASLTSVTVENNTSIQTLSVKDCGSLESLSVNGCSGLTDLDCSNTSTGKISNIDLTGCKSLTNLDCSSNDIKELDVTDCVSLDKLVCNGNGIDSLTGLENCKELKELHCESNAITEDSLDKLEAENLEVLVCGGNKIGKMNNLSRFRKLKRFECQGNQITALQVLRSIFTQLETLNCKGQKANGVRSRMLSSGGYEIDMSIYTTIAGKLANAGMSIMAADISDFSSGFYTSEAGDITGLQAYDDDNLLENLSAEAGVYIYASQPDTIKYNYDTGYGGDEGLMDVEISGAENEPGENSDKGGSSGGCDTGLSGLAVLLTAAALALKKRKA